MKKNLFVVFSLLACMMCMVNCKPREELNRCGAVEDFNSLVAKDPTVKTRADKIETDIREYLQRYKQGADNSDASVRGGLIIIPVVVHVLYNNGTSDATNVPDARINEQIDRLNADFRRANTDAGSVPAAFAGVAADSRIEFQLCRRDPSCNATNGITRNQVSATSFTAHDAKFNSTGGLDAWDTRKYLNIWVVPQLCNSRGCNLLGSASFPSYPSNEWGFVVAFRWLGNATAPYNLGRTATHEFGHFYNLKHIWGDDCGPGDGVCSAPAECNGTDDVGDTPNQGEMTFDAPTFPQTDCCNGTSPGIMFMNYMDYVDDAAMYMFTQGQVDRMVAALYTTMSGLLSSDALIPPAASASPDLFIADTPEDIGNEPNNESDVFYVSPDIWVRNQNDGRMNMEHQNGLYRAGGPSNFVYVRIRNRGCQTSTAANVKLYWAKASTGLGWPDPWNGGVTVGTATMGNVIGTQSTGAVAGGSSTILEFAWNPPNPADYSSFGGDQGHFCLLARIEMPAPTEGSDLWENVKNNNNIAWKNIEVATSASGGREASTLVSNYNESIDQFALGFAVPRREESPFVNYDSIFLLLPPKLLEAWKAAGSKGENIVTDNRGRIRLLNAAAVIDGLPIKYSESLPVTVQFTGDRRRKGPHVYFFDIVQYTSGGSRKPVGAQRVWVKSWVR